MKHDLAKLPLFGESEDTIRLRGRLRKATIDEDLETPMIFSAKHSAMVLMWSQMHEDNHDDRTEYLRSLVQPRFWVEGTRIALRGIKSKSIKRKKLAVHPYMLCG